MLYRNQVALVKSVNGTRIFHWEVSTGKTGLPFQEFRLFRKISSGTNQKVVFHLQPDRNFRNFLVNGKRSTFSGIPFIPENFQWNEPKSRVPFTTRPEFPEFYAPYSILDIRGLGTKFHLDQSGVTGREIGDSEGKTRDYEGLGFM